MKLGMRGALGLVLIVIALFALPRVLWKQRPVEVDLASVETGTVETIVANSEAGTVRARAISRLSADRAGRVVSIAAREGAFVVRGATLVRLDSSTARARLESARRDFAVFDAAHEAQHAEARLARQSYERTRELRARGLVPDEQMEASESRMESADAALHAAEARRAAAEAAIRVQLDELVHLEVRAPFDGVVSRRFVELGETVAASHALLELVSLQRLYVSAPIDERDAAMLATGCPARVTLDAFPGRSWNGTVVRIAPIVEETEDQNRTIEVEVEIDGMADSDTILVRPGMTADIEIVLDRRESVFRIPTTSVIEGRSALVVTKGRAVVRPITIGASNWQWSEVTSGLAAGDSVITSLDRPGVQAGVTVRSRPDAGESSP